MAIKTAPNLIHWNYFLALEADLANLARFVEFSPDNFNAYSIEMVHLLLAAASEVDVVLRQFCATVDPGTKAGNIEEYRAVLNVKEPQIAAMSVSLPRFVIELEPWANWRAGQSPNWWRDHNKVKHERGANYACANLKNVLNAMGALFIVVVLFYRKQPDIPRLVPAPNLLQAPRELVSLAHSMGGETGLYYGRERS